MNLIKHMKQANEEKEYKTVKSFAFAEDKGTKELMSQNS